MEQIKKNSFLPQIHSDAVQVRCSVRRTEWTEEKEWQNVKNHYNHSWKSLYYIIKTNNKHNKWTKTKSRKKRSPEKKKFAFFVCVSVRVCYWMLHACVNYGLSTPKASNLRVPTFECCMFYVRAYSLTVHIFLAHSLTLSMCLSHFFLCSSVCAFHLNSLFSLYNSFPLHSITQQTQDYEIYTCMNVSVTKKKLL